MRKSITKRRFIVSGLMVLGLALVFFGSSAQAVARTEGQASSPQVVVIKATGPVAPPMQNYIARGIREADALNADALVIQLDTPGGSVTTMFEIVQDIRASDIPVIVYVGPRGAKAASAGLLITLAGHASAMAPETAIGASSPIAMTGDDIPSTAQEKEENYLSAQARSLAERRGREAMEIASEAVTEARAVSASEALSAGLIDVMAEDVADLLSQLDGFSVEINGETIQLNLSGAVVITEEMTWIEELLGFITNPNIVLIFLNLGVLALIVEIRTPGGWIAGVTGVTLLAFAMYGLGVLPVNWLGILFILMAFVLFILEIKMASGGLAAAGVLSLIAGGLILFNDPAIAPFGRLSIPLLIGQSLLIGALFAAVIVFALRAQRLQPTTGREGMVGQFGRVTRVLDPIGMVAVTGERWKAESSDGSTIDRDQEVEVLGTEGMRVLVRARQKRDV